MRARVVVLVLIALVASSFQQANAGPTPACPRTTPAPIPMTGEDGSCDGNVIATAGLWSYTLSWPVWRGWAHTVNVTLLTPGASAVVTRSVNGTLVETASGSGTITLTKDEVAFPNPHDLQLTEIIRINGTVPPTSTGAEFSVRVHEQRAATTCARLQVGQACQGRAQDGPLGDITWTQSPGFVSQWSWYPTNHNRNEINVPGGKVATIHFTASGHTFDASWSAPDGSGSATLLPAKDASASWVTKFFPRLDEVVSLDLVADQLDKSWETIHHPEECGELYCAPAWDDHVQRDQWDSRSFGPMNYVVSITNDPDAPPVAIARDITIENHAGSGVETVRLDGSASTDDFRVAQWQWFENGTLIANASMPLVPLSVGTHAIGLVVSDDINQTSTTNITVNILPNDLPTAITAGNVTASDNTGTGNATVLLDGTRSHDNGGITSWTWTVGTFTATGALATITLPVGTYASSLRVTDLANAADTANFTVRVLPNDAPIPRVLLRCLYNECAMDSRTSTDGDGTIVATSWLIDGAPVSTSARYRTTLPYGAHTVQFNVTDDGGIVNSTTQVVTLVRPPRVAPPPVTPFDVTVVDRDLSDPGDFLGGQFHPTYGWIDPTPEEIGVTLGVHPLPQTPLPQMMYREFFTIGTKTFSVESDGAKFDLYQGNATHISNITGQWRPDLGVVWWDVPTRLVGAPGPGTPITRVGIQTYLKLGATGVAMDNSPSGRTAFPSVDWP